MIHPSRISKHDKADFVNRAFEHYLTVVPAHVLGWVAGIVDGEGCIFISRVPKGTAGRVNDCYGVGLKVTMGCRKTIDTLATLFGHGSTHEVKQPRFNDAWTWLVQSTRMHPVLLALRPHLITKAEEADLALEFLRLPNYTGRTVPPEIVQERHRLYEAMKQAKPRNRL